MNNTSNPQNTAPAQTPASDVKPTAPAAPADKPEQKKADAPANKA
jgi:hypothetical protein